MATKREKQGTIHEIEHQLANLEFIDSKKPKSKQSIKKYTKLFEELKLFPPRATKQKKEQIIKNISIFRFDEDEILNQKQKIKSIEKLNRIIEKERRKIENQIRAKKNVRENDLILKNKERVEIKIPDSVRNDLGIKEKAIFLFKRKNDFYKNKLNYFSGQPYSFVIKTGFQKPFFVPEAELQKIRKEGNVSAWLINEFKKQVEKTYEQDKLKYAKKEPKKWKQKQKIYKKIFSEVLEHNIQIATNKKYNKKFVKRDENGNISEEDSEVPILMEIFDELIDLYIP